jgi:hypothetical protein
MRPITLVALFMLMIGYVMFRTPAASQQVPAAHTTDEITAWLNDALSRSVDANVTRNWTVQHLGTEKTSMNVNTQVTVEGCQIHLVQNGRWLRHRTVTRRISEQESEKR